MKMPEKASAFTVSTFTFTFAISLLITACSAITLNEDGYYKLQIAVDERTVQNGVADYVQNIKLGIQDLSDLLHYTTKGRFSIQEATILVPPHWDSEFDRVATSEFYEDADIKISHTFSLPFVNNPNTCGLPGFDMQLPYNFFDHGDNGTYGRLGKALLAQFARLRFGVWEEHGFPGDPKFSYYWKPLDGTDWEINACSDQPIRGVYRNITDGQLCGPDPDDVEKLYPPPSDCRFYPDRIQEAKSSLMSYHYLPTVESFCDFNTHDRRKPTPQNFYCDYKSVQEIIEYTSDWLMVKGNNTSNRVKIDVIKRSDRPLLYIMLDAGLSSVPAAALQQLSSKLATFISSKEMRNVVSTLLQFPGEGGVSTSSDLVPWSLVRNKTEDFTNYMQTTFGKQGGFKNYAGALQTAVQYLEKRDHAPGSAILLVKTAPEYSTENLTPESDVLKSLLVGNLKVFVAEIHGSQMQYKNALERVALLSDGDHLTLVTPTDLGQPLDAFLNKLKATLQAPFERSKKYVSVFTQALEAGPSAAPPISVKLNTRIRHFEVFVRGLVGGLGNVQLIRGEGGNYEDVFLTEIVWDGLAQVPPEKTSFYYSSVDHSEDPLDSLEWDKFQACNSNCRVLLDIYAEVEDIEEVPQDIRLTVTSSAVNGVVDLTDQSTWKGIGVPFAIYAKLEQGSVPIRDAEGLTVEAIISSLIPEERNSRVVTLQDNANGAPDIATNDGIFSGYFIPDTNFDEGEFNILVIAKYTIPVPETTTTATSEPFREVKNRDLQSAYVNVGRLFPVDQGKMGCGSGFLGCSAKFPDTEFVVSADLGIIKFLNPSQFSFITRINDIIVTPLPNYEVNLQWLAPRLITTEVNYERVEIYEIRHHENFDKLLFETDDADTIQQQLNAKNPGELEDFTFPFNRQSDIYLAIRSSTLINDYTKVSDLSVIVGIHIREEIIITTTTTTTTPKPEITSTLPPSPTTTGPSTTEEEFTSTTTTVRTTQARTTSARTTVTTTTPTPSTTTASTTTSEPIKHWFETTEGIITISVVGTALVFMLSGSVALIWIMRNR